MNQKRSGCREARRRASTPSHSPSTSLLDLARRSGRSSPLPYPPARQTNVVHTRLEATPQEIFTPA